MKENDYSKRPDIDTYYNIEFLVEGDSAYICDRCVDKAKDIVNENLKKEYLGSHLCMKKPLIIKNELDQHIIGQDLAKRTVSVAVYNHFKRINSQYDENARSGMVRSKLTYSERP